MQARKLDIEARVERQIDAPAELVYRLIADYNNHHAEILPPSISDLVVEEGGIGEGTVISFDVEAGGRSRRMRAIVNEPRHGVLTETDLDTGSITTFTVTPRNDGSQVEIRTEFHSAPGLRGWIERRFAPRLLKKEYQKQLANLDRYAQEVASAADTSPHPVTSD